MQVDQSLDCKGLSCPMPIIRLSKAAKSMQSGEVLEMIASDAGAKADVPAWCSKTGNTLLEEIEDGNSFKFYIRIQ